MRCEVRVIGNEGRDIALRGRNKELERRVIEPAMRVIKYRVSGEGSGSCEIPGRTGVIGGGDIDRLSLAADEEN